MLSSNVTADTTYTDQCFFRPTNKLLSMNMKYRVITTNPGKKALLHKLYYVSILWLELQRSSLSALIRLLCITLCKSSGCCRPHVCAWLPEPLYTRNVPHLVLNKAQINLHTTHGRCNIIGCYIISGVKTN